MGKYCPGLQSDHIYGNHQETLVVDTALTRYLEMAFSIIAAFIPVALGMVIKNKSLKIVCIILGTLFAIFMIYSSIQMMKYMM